MGRVLTRSGPLPATPLRTIRQDPLRHRSLRPPLPRPRWQSDLSSPIQTGVREWVTPRATLPSDGCAIDSVDRRTIETVFSATIADRPARGGSTTL